MAIRTLYQSTYSHFMNRFLSTHPDVEKTRANLRKTWWQNTVDTDTAKQFISSTIPKKPYTYE